MTIFSGRIRSLNMNLALVALVTALAGTSVAEANARLARFFGERFGRFALIETAEGKALSREILGRQARSGADLDELLTRLRRREMRPLGDELADRLERMRASLESGEAGAAGRRALTAAEKRTLEALSRDELAFELTSEGRLRFAGRADAATFATTRQRFARARAAAAESEFAGAEAARLVRRYRNPLRDAFPDTLSTSPLESRVGEFVSRHSDRVRVVDDVEFKLPGNFGVSDKRRVVVVSLKDLDATQLEAITSEYLNAIGRGTVSFPLSEQAGHLYTRTGTKVYDFMGGDLTAREYRMPENYSWSGSSSRRLEPIIELNLEEELRLRKYVQNGTERGDRTLGEFGYDGVRDGATRGQLNNNRPVGRGVEHNCTTWLATAPVGARGDALKALVGARPGWEIHTNPGWWQAFLVSSPAARERVPFVFYWTHESLSEALRKVRPNHRLSWSFSAH